MFASIGRRSCRAAVRLCARPPAHNRHAAEPMEDMVRKFWGMMVIAVLASTSLVSTTLVTPAFSARPPYQYGWWQKDRTAAGSGAAAGVRTGGGCATGRIGFIAGAKPGRRARRLPSGGARSQCDGPLAAILIPLARFPHRPHLG